MAERIPSFFMLVPGPWRNTRALVDGLRVRGVPADATSGTSAAGAIRVEVVADQALAAGFQWGPDGATPAALIDAVRACDHAAVIEVSGRLDERAADAASIGRALRDLGGVAVRMEASGAASTWELWLGRMESGAASSIYAASVVVVGDDSAMFTVGMHQFDLPDGRHNPFGVWRLVRDDDHALGALDPIPTIIPSLVAMLLAAEREKGDALAEAEVDRVVDEAPAIAMSADDVRTLERMRGYADIEPRRAWAQWQLVRSTLH